MLHCSPNFAVFIQLILKMNLLIEKVSDLNDLIMQGLVEEAFEKFYHEDIIIQRNDEQPVKGKKSNRKLQMAFMNNIVEFKSARPLKVTIGEKTTMVEWQLNYKHKEHGERKYTKVAVQDWNEGLIIKEKVYCALEEL